MATSHKQSNTTTGCQLVGRCQNSKFTESVGHNVLSFGPTYKILLCQLKRWVRLSHSCHVICHLWWCDWFDSRSVILAKRKKPSDRPSFAIILVVLRFVLTFEVYSYLYNYVTFIECYLSYVKLTELLTNCEYKILIHLPIQSQKYVVQSIVYTSFSRYSTYTVLILFTKGRIFLSNEYLPVDTCS